MLNVAMGSALLNLGCPCPFQVVLDVAIGSALLNLTRRPYLVSKDVTIGGALAVENVASYWCDAIDENHIRVLRARS